MADEKASTRATALLGKSRGTEQDHAHGAPGTRVMVVDDEPGDCTLVRHWLNGTGGRYAIVSEATDGDEAFRHAETLQPDLVILDIDMPGHDGLEVLTELRKRLPDSLIVVYGHECSPGLVADVAHAGGSAFMTKDLPEDWFVQCLDKVVQEPRGTRQKIPAYY